MQTGSEENSDVQMFNVEMRLYMKSFLKRRKTEVNGDHKPGLGYYGPKFLQLKLGYYKQSEVDSGESEQWVRRIEREVTSGKWNGEWQVEWGVASG